MKKYLFFISVVLLIGCGSSESYNPVLYISGDDLAVEAQIYVDGNKAGVMEKHIYTGSTSKDPVIKEREQKEQIRMGIKPGDIFSGANIRISPGQHEIMFISKKGTKLKKRIIMKSENYINIDFTKMTIEGGEE